MKKMPLSSPPARPGRKLNLGDPPRPPAEGQSPSALPCLQQRQYAVGLRGVLVLVLLTLIAAFTWSTSAQAQGAVDVRASNARGDFPNGIVFTLEAASEGIDEVRLVYEIAPDGVRTSAV